MRKQLDKQRVEMEKTKIKTRKEVIRQVHLEAEEKRKLHEKKMIQIQMKCQLEARNKILIQKKIEAHQKARKQLLQRYFSHWSQENGL